MIEKSSMKFIIPALLLLVSLVPVYADERVNLDGTVELNMSFYNQSDNKTYMDMEITIDIEDSIDLVIERFEEIEFRNKSNTKEEENFILKLNIDELTREYEVNEFDNVKDIIAGVCDGKNCSTAYHECKANVTSLVGLLSTCEGGIQPQIDDAVEDIETERDNLQTNYDNLEIERDSLVKERDNLKTWRMVFGVIIAIMGILWYRQNKKGELFGKSTTQKTSGTGADTREQKNNQSTVEDLKNALGIK